MSSKKPVVIYGVTGYTGRLVAEYLREYRTPFIAAGRDAKVDDARHTLQQAKHLEGEGRLAHRGVEPDP